MPVSKKKMDASVQEYADGSHRRPRSVASWMARGAALAMGIATSLLMAELLLRLFFPQPASWLSIYRRHPRLPTFSLQPNAQSFVATGESNWWVFTDQDGHRIGSTPEPLERPYVLWLGDSFTFAHGVNFEESWLHLTHSVESARHRAVNAGVAGYGPSQYRAVLLDQLDRGNKPAHVVVVSYLGNDFHDTIWNKDIPVKNGTLGDAGDLKSWIKVNIHSYRLAARIYHRISGSPRSNTQAELNDYEQWATGTLADASSRYSAEFEQMASRCQSAGISFRVILIPTVETVAAVKHHGMTGMLQRIDYRTPLLHAHRIFQDLEISFLDLAPMLALHDPEEMYFAFDGHLTPGGHRVVYEAIAETYPEIQ